MTTQKTFMMMGKLNCQVIWANMEKKAEIQTKKRQPNKLQWTTEKNM